VVRHRGGPEILEEAGQAMCSCPHPLTSSVVSLWVGGGQSNGQEDGDRYFLSPWDTQVSPALGEDKCGNE
jgi:hypothetical protein